MGIRASLILICYNTYTKIKRRKQTKNKDQRKALPYDQVKDCLNAISNSGAGPRTKLALEFLILTASRSGEVREAVWSEIDLDNREWLIPANRMKSKNDHRVPLVPRMIEILQEADNLRDGSSLVFPGMKYGKPISDASMLKLVRSLGYQVDIHGFRTSFRTWAQERTNTPREVVEKALAHSIGNKTEEAYARSDLFEKRRSLMESWEKYLQEKPGNVVELNRL